MRALVTYRLAAVMVFTGAMPAMARSSDVCIDLARTLTLRRKLRSPMCLCFLGVRNIYPRGTFHRSVMASPLIELHHQRGPGSVSFFTKGALMANLPTEVAKALEEMYYID